MTRLTALAAAAALLASPAAFAVPLTLGDLFVYRVGTGTASLTSAATAVFLDEYTTSGSFVQSIAMPTAVTDSNGRLSASGLATSEGLLSASSNGQFIVLGGYDAALGSASIAGTTSTLTPRTVGVVSLSGAVDTTTRLTDYSSGGNPRGVASTNGTDLWVSGAAGGARYTTKGATTSTQLSTTVTNLRSIEIINGQLYASDSSGTTNRLGTIGTGLPTASGQTITNLPGFSTNTGSPYAFFFADLSSTVAGMDTLYVADDASGVTKFSLSGGTWASNGTVGAGADSYRGLTGVVTGSTVSLFATRKGGSGATGGGELVSFDDASGYNGSFTGSATLLATAAANTAFRGVAYLPTAAVPEPATYAMLPAGLAVMGVVARRRRA
jgi:hypothetical protein